jgi:hypothetical protein
MPRSDWRRMHSVSLYLKVSPANTFRLVFRERGIDGKLE